MELLTRSASVRDRIRVWRAAGARVALVPTAGTLHKGHMSLVAEAQERADHVIVSIFADPREREAPTLEADRELLEKMGADRGCSFRRCRRSIPLGRESAAAGERAESRRMFWRAPDRPGYFSRRRRRCITKLFNLVKPDIALFGERDFQQLVMVRRLVDDLFLSIEVVGCATWRDGDGLAVATANRHLTPRSALSRRACMRRSSEIARKNRRGRARL